MNNKLLTGLVALALVLGSVGAFKGSDAAPAPAPQLGALAGPNVYEPLVLYGGQTFSRTNATSSSVATYTLTSDDIAPNNVLYNTVFFTKTGAVATTTWTFPASSTVAALPNAGDRASMCFRPATTTAVGLILAEGTGWSFEMASTTDLRTLTLGGNNGTLARTIQGDTTACVDIMRQEDTNFLLRITPSGEAQ